MSTLHAIIFAVDLALVLVNLVVLAFNIRFGNGKMAAANVALIVLSAALAGWAATS